MVDDDILHLWGMVSYRACLSHDTEQEWDGRYYVLVALIWTILKCFRSSPCLCDKSVSGE